MTAVHCTGTWGLSIVSGQALETHRWIGHASHHGRAQGDERSPCAEEWMNSGHQKVRRGTLAHRVDSPVSGL